MKEFDHRSRLAENFEEKTYLKSSTIDEDSVDTAHFDNTYDSDLKKEDENIWEESEIELKSLLTANCKPEMLEKDPLASSNLYVVKKEREKAVIREIGLYTCQICSEGFTKHASFLNHHRRHGKNLRKQFPYSYAAKKTIKVVRDKIKCTREKKLSKSVHTFYCIVCSQKFSRVYTLKKHLQAEHNISEDPRRTIKDIRPIQIEDFGGEYKFFYCLCSCVHKGDQGKHEDFSHNDETPFVCDLCYCSFPKDIYLKHHISKFHRQVSINLRQISLEKTDTFIANSNQSSQETNAPKSSRNGSSNETSFSIDHSELNSNSTLLQKTPNKRISQVTVKNQASSVNKSPDLRYNAGSYFSHDNISEEERYDSDMNSVPSSSHEIIENLAEQEVSDENSVPSSDEIIEKVMKQEVNDEVCQKKQVDYKRELEKIPECESDHDDQLWSQFVILDDD